MKQPQHSTSARHQRSLRFAFEQALDRLQLGGRVRQTGLVLAHHMDRSGVTAVGQRRLLDVYSISAGRLRADVRQMVEAGVLQAEHRRGHRGATVYRSCARWLGDTSDVVLDDGSVLRSPRSIEGDDADDHDNPARSSGLALADDHDNPARPLGLALADDHDNPARPLGLALEVESTGHAGRVARLFDDPARPLGVAEQDTNTDGGGGGGGATSLRSAAGAVLAADAADPPPGPVVPVSASVPAWRRIEGDRVRKAIAMTAKLMHEEGVQCWPVEGRQVEAELTRLFGGGWTPAMLMHADLADGLPDEIRSPDRLFATRLRSLPTDPTAFGPSMRARVEHADRSAAEWSKLFGWLAEIPEPARLALHAVNLDDVEPYRAAWVQAVYSRRATPVPLNRELRSPELFSHWWGGIFDAIDLALDAARPGLFAACSELIGDDDIEIDHLIAAVEKFYGPAALDAATVDDGPAVLNVEPEVPASPTELSGCFDGRARPAAVPPVAPAAPSPGPAAPVPPAPPHARPPGPAVAPPVASTPPGRSQATARPAASPSQPAIPVPTGPLPAIVIPVPVLPPVAPSKPAPPAEPDPAAEPERPEMVVDAELIDRHTTEAERAEIGDDIEALCELVMSRANDIELRAAADRTHRPQPHPIAAADRTHRSSTRPHRPAPATEARP
ncbi:MAG: hypothetical protein AB7O92_24615 [Acidimicrobiia bacterium]